MKKVGNQGGNLTSKPLVTCYYTYVSIYGTYIVSYIVLYRFESKKIGKTRKKRKDSYEQERFSDGERYSMCHSN